MRVINLKLFLTQTFYLVAINAALALNTWSQEDSIPYKIYRNQIVLYTDFGYTSAPFSLNYPFQESLDKLKYRNNYRAVMGLGGSYKWFSLRIRFALPGSVKSEDKFGTTKYRGLGVNFTKNRFYWDIDVRTFKGYAITNAKQWNDSLSKEVPNDIRSNTSSTGISINTWYFYNPYYKMPAVFGIKGHYLKEVRSWYLKSTFNIYGIGNDQYSIVPLLLIDPKNSKTQSTSFSAVDVGVIPGYAYVNRQNNWQVAGLLGLGAVLQSKQYKVENETKRYLGIAPRYDVRFVGGYSAPSYFVFLQTEIDNKSIRFGDFIYKQSFYAIKLVLGFRFNHNKKDLHQ